MVGHVLVRGDEPLSAMGGPSVVDEGAVFAIPVERLEDVWHEGSGADEPFDADDMAEGYFETSRRAVTDGGGAFARLDDEGTFVLALPAGDHLLCHSRSPGDDVVRPNGCHSTTLPDPPARVRVWTGEDFAVEVLAA